MARSKAKRGRFSSRKKVEVVLRVLRGEDLVSRGASITAVRLSAWCNHFVTSGQAAMKSRAADGQEEDLAQLKALVGDLTMRMACSREAVSRLRASTPGGSVQLQVDPTMR